MNSFIASIFMMNVQNKRLQRDLDHSEAARMEAVRKAAAEVTRQEDAACQLEETRSENKSLTNQVFGPFMLDRFTCSTSKQKVYFLSRRCLWLSSEGEGSPQQTDQPGE